MLDGAAESLKEVLGIHAELPVKHLYENVWSLSEALDYLAERHFVLCQVQPTNYDVVDRMAAIELDCIFRSTSPQHQA